MMFIEEVDIKISGYQEAVIFQLKYVEKVICIGLQSCGVYKKIKETVLLHVIFIQPIIKSADPNIVMAVFKKIVHIDLSAFRWHGRLAKGGAIIPVNSAGCSDPQYSTTVA